MGGQPAICLRAPRAFRTGGPGPRERQQQLRGLNQAQDAFLLAPQSYNGFAGGTPASALHQLRPVSQASLVRP